MKNNSQNASDWRRGATSVRWRTHSIIAIVNTDFSLNNNFRHMNHMNPPCVWPFEQKFNCESVELIDTFVNKKLTFMTRYMLAGPLYRIVICLVTEVFMNIFLHLFISQYEIRLHSCICSNPII